MAKSLQDTLRQCLEDLERCYDKGNDKDIQETLQKIFCLKDVDFYSLVLAIVKESKHVYYLQRKSIAEVTLNTFKNWLLSKVNEFINFHFNKKMFHFISVLLD